MSKEITAVKTIDDHDELDVALTFEEAIAFSGLPEEQTVFIASNYEVVNQDKDSLLRVPFFIRLVNFKTDDKSGNEYSISYLVTKDNRMVVMTDGSTGIYRQLAKLVAARAEDGHPTPTQNIFIPNGLRKSDYIVEGVGEATTYYLA